MGDIYHFTVVMHISTEQSREQGHSHSQPNKLSNHIEVNIFFDPPLSNHDLK